MAGLYLHIPFCKQACHYCDFHFSTNQTLKEEMVSALLKEMEMQREYLSGETIETIYFGGGTPSLLSSAQLESLLVGVSKNFTLAQSLEITLEANPDDLSPLLLMDLRAIGFNRLSIGIQSFDESVLIFFNRAHNAAQSITCIENARQAGFDNISIDLIYSIPQQSLAEWKENIVKAISLRPEHISAYALTIEDKTVLGHRQKKGLLKPLAENESAFQVELLIVELEGAGYNQYEISNFCRPGFYSKHNTSYWQQKKYVGLGPSAHSYDGITRQWNVANNHAYLNSIKKGALSFEKEVLTRSNKINEYIFTTLRTKWGCSVPYLTEVFDFTLDQRKLDKYTKQGLLRTENRTIFLTAKGKLLADHIAMDLFVDAG
jgi:oxygen-independent coproporphyrinogen-3 oxidase